MAEFHSSIPTYLILASDLVPGQDSQRSKLDPSGIMKGNNIGNAKVVSDYDIHQVALFLGATDAEVVEYISTCTQLPWYHRYDQKSGSALMMVPLVDHITKPLEILDNVWTGASWSQISKHLRKTKPGEDRQRALSMLPAVFWTKENESGNDPFSVGYHSLVTNYDVGNQFVRYAYNTHLPDGNIRNKRERLLRDARDFIERNPNAPSYVLWIQGKFSGYEHNSDRIVAMNPTSTVAFLKAQLGDTINHTLNAERIPMPLEQRQRYHKARPMSLSSVLSNRASDKWIRPLPCIAGRPNAYGLTTSEISSTTSGMTLFNMVPCTTVLADRNNERLRSMIATHLDSEANDGVRYYAFKALETFKVTYDPLAMLSTELEDVVEQMSGYDFVYMPGDSGDAYNCVAREPLSAMRAFARSMEPYRGIYNVIVMPAGTGKTTMARNEYTSPNDWNYRLIDIDTIIPSSTAEYKALVSQALETGDWDEVTRVNHDALLNSNVTVADILLVHSAEQFGIEVNVLGSYKVSEEQLYDTIIARVMEEQDLIEMKMRFPEPSIMLGGIRGELSLEEKMFLMLEYGTGNAWYVDGSTPSDYPALALGYSVHAARGTFLGKRFNNARDSNRPGMEFITDDLILLKNTAKLANDVLKTFAMNTEIGKALLHNWKNTEGEILPRDLITERVRVTLDKVPVINTTLTMFVVKHTWKDMGYGSFVAMSHRIYGWGRTMDTLREQANIKTSGHMLHSVIAVLPHLFQYLYEVKTNQRTQESIYSFSFDEPRGGVYHTQLEYRRALEICKQQLRKRGSEIYSVPMMKSKISIVDFFLVALFA